MKLGNTREEMQKNYSETIKKGRKVGKILGLIGVASSIASLYLFIMSLNVSPAITIEHLLLLSMAIICPIGGYIGGHMYYYGFRRIASMLEGLDGVSDNESGCLCFLLAFGGLGTAIAFIVAFGLFFSVGMYIGLYDWIKIHIDGKRYGLKVE